MDPDMAALEVYESHDEILHVAFLDEPHGQVLYVGIFWAHPVPKPRYLDHRLHVCDRLLHVDLVEIACIKV